MYKHGDQIEDGMMIENLESFEKVSNSFQKY